MSWTVAGAQDLASTNATVEVPSNTVSEATNAPSREAGAPAMRMESDLRALYLSARGAQSIGPAGPAMIKPKAAAEPSDAGPWRRSVEAGLTVNRGNTDSDLYLLRLEARHRVDGSEFLASAQGQYGENDGERDKEAALAKARYSRDLTARTFQALDLRGYYDALADLDYQVIATWTYGYRLFQEEDTFLSVEAGPGYVEEKKLGDTEGYIAAHLAERGEARVNDAVIIWHAIDYFPSLEDASRYLVAAEAGVDSALNHHMRFRAALQDRYDSLPAAEKKKNDLATIVSLVLDF